MLTPLDIQKKEFRRRLRGYCEEEVDEFWTKSWKTMKCCTGKMLALKMKSLDLRKKQTVTRTWKRRYAIPWY